MRVHVEHSIGDLIRDYVRIAAVQAPRDMMRVVEHNVDRGHSLAQRFARGSSGPHGRLYYKRITKEMLGPLSGEYGPTGDVAGNAVGAGWRNGPPNTDLPRSADIVGPNMAKMMMTRVGRWSW